MKSAMFVSYLVSCVAFAAFGAGGCAAESDDEVEDTAETQSDLSCKRVVTSKMVNGKVTRSTSIKCDGSKGTGGTDGRTPPPATGDGTGTKATCSINGRKAVCDNGNCVAINGEPGPGCRWLE